MHTADISVLVVDDEPRYIKLVEYNLQGSGYRVVTATCGNEALQRVARENPDLVILDIRMPGMDGYEVCQRIRDFSVVPIIMLTAKGEDSEKVRGLRLGADDYITKPFSAEELLARVEAVLRRSCFSETIGPHPTLSWGDLSIDFAQRRVTVAGREVKLSPTEYRLLHCLAAHAGRVVVQQEILEKVWGPEYREPFEGLRVYVRRLRQKIESDPDDPRHIVTHAGVGYMLALQ
ncbi:MAG: response regulator transcription factor [Chloroflexi bacterium]|nr:response regulator transcription factor [Chloroflexota bacterium]